MYCKMYFEFVGVLEALLKTMISFSQMESSFKKYPRKISKQCLSENSASVRQTLFFTGKLCPDFRKNNSFSKFRSNFAF